ncbi:protocadherin-10-like [Pristis pectinata]|uniref:protocadherin-10-like n=1 Tax=Pristis pectinata TaxID=685728 RepID=UPI00223CB098|nr:protocadherin-10-like [Pristis pectinata]
MADSAMNAASAFKTCAFMFMVCTPDLIFGRIRYSIPEELELGAFVGNLAQDLRLNVPQLSSRKLRLTSDTVAQYMKVNLENGILSVRERIDREHVCGQRNICTISFEVILENPLEVYRGEVEILDVNDNSPTFRDSTIALQIAETIAPGVGFPLESAEDPDIGVNAITAYTISSSEYFSLKTQTTEDGFIIAKLLLEKPLDREVQSSFQLVLTATDGGTPQRSGTAQIHITVVDINDNPPVFDHEIYRGSLREDAPRGTLVMKVKATDIDEGMNAELTYVFSKLASARVRELFSLDPQTGEIWVEGPLDFEEAQDYSLNIQAVDQGLPAMLADSKVLIKVIDVNDNAPEVKVTSGVSKIPENSPLGTIITLINVIDRDSGANGQFHCDIPKHLPFRLQISSKNHYELITSEPLDRESVPEYKIPFVARDLGSPSLSTHENIQIVISDINDNEPRFSESSYNIYVMENNTPGTSIFAVTASDLDLDLNSHVSYALQEKLIQNLPMSSYLSINSMNGSIYALRSFDYEELKSFQIYVQAHDAGVPPLSSSVTVNVIILDQNDNPPVIVSPSAQRGSAAIEVLPQSAGQGYLVTKIMATDEDSGQNARLLYQMVKSTEPSLFNVGQSTGEIRTARNILESDPTTQTLVILVKDNGQPSLSSTVTIQIRIMENITERITESNNLVSSPENFSDLNLYFIVIFACTSILFLVAIILLIGIKCKQDRTITQEYNSPSCCYKCGDSNDTFNHRPAMEETLRYPGTGRIVRVPEVHHYSVSLSPESAKSDFLFLKPCGAPTSRVQC